MEKIDKGLSVTELEAQKVELLPDRLEMSRRGCRNKDDPRNETFGDVIEDEMEEEEGKVITQGRMRHRGKEERDER